MSLNHALLHSRPRYPGLVNSNLGSWSPRSLAGLQLWLDATTITGLADGDKVSQWNDLSGNAKHAVNANATYQPIYKIGLLNDLPAVQFGAAGDGVKLTTGSISIGNFSLYIVTSPISRKVTYPIIIEQDNVNYGIVIQNEASTTTFRYVLGAGDREGTALSNGANYLLTFLSDSTTIYAWINATSQGTSANTSGGTTRSKTITLGEQNESGNCYHGYIMEVLLYDSKSSESDRSRISGYLNDKWAIY